ncbi:MAG: putative conjugal transfer protein [Candidatus Sulfotelmatobacter sp.]|jgi:type IV secretory pathway component VirB8|nr:putative conjugal transfer protein [Candidatus Sulfotelmatobacter sp.]
MSDKEFNEAKQLYLEKYGDSIVTNNYLKIALLLLCLAALALVFLNLRTIRIFQNFRPLVIRIDQLGRAQAVDYKSLEYLPGDREAKYFLSEFCRLYYRRNRYTIHDDFTNALYFLDGKLANDTMEQHKKEDTVDKFLTNPSSPEVDIEIQKVALETMEKAPYRAAVDFYRVEYAPADHSVLSKTLYTANFVFLFKDEVPNELIPVNPLGMTITYFRDDEAFTSETTR